MPRIPTSDLLDRLMSEIPGKDNYPGNLEDNTHIEGVAYEFVIDIKLSNNNR